MAADGRDGGRLCLRRPVRELDSRAGPEARFADAQPAGAQPSVAQPPAQPAGANAQPSPRRRRRHGLSPPYLPRPPHRLPLLPPSPQLPHPLHPLRLPHPPDRRRLRHSRRHRAGPGPPSPPSPRGDDDGEAVAAGAIVRRDHAGQSGQGRRRHRYPRPLLRGRDAGGVQRGGVAARLQIFPTPAMKAAQAGGVDQIRAGAPRRCLRPG